MESRKFNHDIEGTKYLKNKSSFYWLQIISMSIEKRIMKLNLILMQKEEMLAYDKF